MLSGLLGAVTDALSTLLNLIPLLGLGDLITILLNGGVLKVESLIPIGYVNPILTDCSASGNVIVSGQKYTGGFAGESIGAVMKNCSVEGTDSVSGDYSRFCRTFFQCSCGWPSEQSWYRSNGKFPG